MKRGKAIEQKKIEAYIGNAANLFDECGNLVNDSTREFVARYMHAFAAWVETNTSGRKP
jgi:chromate reductase